MARTGSGGVRWARVHGWVMEYEGSAEMLGGGALRGNEV